MVSYNPGDPDWPSDDDRLIPDIPLPSWIPRSDPVRHPGHYYGPPCPECGTPIETRVLVEEMPYFRGAAVKYLMRAGKKDRDKEVEDLRKAAQCASMEADRLEHGVGNRIYEWRDVDPRGAELEALRKYAEGLREWLLKDYSPSMVPPVPTFDGEKDDPEK